MRNRASVVIVLAAAVAAGGCQDVYFGTMETFGKHKRDILVERVASARDEQEEAKEQFESALAKFQALSGHKGGDLEAEYRVFKNELEASEKRAKAVRDRVRKVEEVATALFGEWNKELDAYHDPKLRRASEQQLRDTRRQYATLIRRMHQAEARMAPVLEAFEDQVLFLKHNLNAQAIGALENELGRIRADVDQLIRDMEQAMAESDDFVRSLRQP